MLVVVELLRGVDAQRAPRIAWSCRRRPRAITVTVFRRAALESDDVERLLAGRARELCAFSPSLNCSGSTPMPMRLERWMRSKLSAMTALTPSSIVPLAAQSRELPVPYSLPARITSGVPSALYFMAASKIDIDSPLGMCTVTPPSVPGSSRLRKPDVGERAAHHHLVVAAARPVGIEIRRLARPVR